MTKKRQGKGITLEAPQFSLWTIVPDAWLTPPGGWVAAKRASTGGSGRKAKPIRSDEDQLRPFRARIRSQNFSKRFD